MINRFYIWTALAGIGAAFTLLMAGEALGAAALFVVCTLALALTDGRS